MSIESLYVYVFLPLLAAWGFYGLVWPEKVMKYWNAEGWFNRWIRGGAFYSSAPRTRLTCLALIGIAVMGLIASQSV
jgi:hypothetical protein